MDDIPPTQRVVCNTLSRVGPSGSVRGISMIRMKPLQARLRSFDFWRGGPSGPLPIDLASAGFIYHGVADQTQCYSCCVVVTNWLPVHDPVQEHYRHSPHCVFLYDTFEAKSSSSFRTNDISLAKLSPQATVASPVEASLCKICFSNKMEILFRPCGHLLTCRSCANQMTTCPICRSSISETIRAFVSFE